LLDLRHGDATGGYQQQRSPSKNWKQQKHAVAIYRGVFLFVDILNYAAFFWRPGFRGVAASFLISSTCSGVNTKRQPPSN
jgi:hypothetical protein